MCIRERNYIDDLLLVIKTYDDLSDGELKYLAKLQANVSTAQEKVLELKKEIPVHYLIQIKARAESIDAQSEIIMFTEDLRNVND